MHHLASRPRAPAHRLSSWLAFPPFLAHSRRARTLTGCDAPNYLSFLTDFGLRTASLQLVTASRPGSRQKRGSSTSPTWSRRATSAGAQRCSRRPSVLPPAVHVAVVDPGVGTDRRGDRRPGRRHDPGRAGQRAAVLGGRRRSAAPSRAFVLTNSELWNNQYRQRSTAATSSCRWPRTWPTGTGSPGRHDIDVADLVTLLSSDKPDARRRGRRRGDVGRPVRQRAALDPGCGRGRWDRDRLLDVDQVRPARVLRAVLLTFGAAAPVSSSPSPTARG